MISVSTETLKICFVFKCRSTVEATGHSHNFTQSHVLATPLKDLNHCAAGVLDTVKKAQLLAFGFISKNGKPGNYFLRLQVLISHAEDGSGGPLYYDDVKDLMFPREPAALERTLRESSEPQSIITVRQRIYIHIHVAE